MTPTKNLELDGNFIYIITRCSYSGTLKLRYTKSILNRAHLLMVMVSITKIISKQAHVIHKLGRFGTGVPLAPVLLFELYLAINYSSTSYVSNRR